MTRGGQVDPGPLHQRGDHVIIELLDGDHDEHRPNGLSHVSIEQSNESSEGAADHRAEKRDQIEKAGDDADQEPERQVDEPHADAGSEADDDRDQKLTPDERAQSGADLPRHEGEFLTVARRCHAERVCLEPLEIDQDVEGERPGPGRARQPPRPRP